MQVEPFLPSDLIIMSAESYWYSDHMINCKSFLVLRLYVCQNPGALDSKNGKRLKQRATDSEGFLQDIHQQHCLIHEVHIITHGQPASLRKVQIRLMRCSPHVSCYCGANLRHLLFASVEYLFFLFPHKIIPKHLTVIQTFCARLLFYLLLPSDLPVCPAYPALPIINLETPALSCGLNIGNLLGSISLSLARAIDRICCTPTSYIAYCKTSSPPVRLTRPFSCW